MCIRLKGTLYSSSAEDIYYLERYFHPFFYLKVRFRSILIQHLFNLYIICVTLETGFPSQKNLSFKPQA